MLYWRKFFLRTQKLCSATLTVCIIVSVVVLGYAKFLDLLIQFPTPAIQKQFGTGMSREMFLPLTFLTFAFIQLTKDCMYLCSSIWCCVIKGRLQNSAGHIVCSSNTDHLFHLSKQLEWPLRSRGHFFCYPVSHYTGNAICNDVCAKIFKVDELF